MGVWVVVLKSGFIAPEQQAESFLKLLLGEVLSTTWTLRRWAHVRKAPS